MMENPWKLFTRFFAGSLALRVLLINLFCLVLPLVIYSFYSFAHEEKQTTHDVFTVLEIAKDNQIKDLEHMILGEMDFMRLLHNLVIAEKNRGGTLSDQEIATILEEFTSAQNISAISYLTQDAQGHFICRASTASFFIGKDFSATIPLEKLLEEKKYVFVGMDPLSGQDLCVMKILHEPSSSKGLIISMTLLDKLLSQLGKIPYASQGDIFFLSDNYHVLSTNNLPLSGASFTLDKHADRKAFIYLEPMINKKDCYRYFVDGNEYFGIIGSSPTIPFSILLQVTRDDVLGHVYIHMWRIFELLALIILLGSFVTFFLTRRMAKPLNALCSCMEKVGQGDLSIRAQLDPLGFEINTISERFNKTLDSLALSIERAHAEKIRKELFEQELLIGHEIQTAILPKAFPALVKIHVETGYRSAKQVGGDFYDCFATMIDGHKKVLIVIADTSGKGISACLYSLGLRSALRSFAMTTSNLAEIIQKTNELFLLDTGESGMFVTAWVGLFNPEDLTLSYTNLGHFPVLLFPKEGPMDSLTTDGLAMGITQYDHIPVATKQLSSGNRLIFYTDGIVEATSSNNTMFGQARFIETVTQNHNLPLQEFVTKIFSDVDGFVKQAPQHDDMTLLVIDIL